MTDFIDCKQPPSRHGLGNSTEAQKNRMLGYLKKPIMYKHKKNRWQKTRHGKNPAKKKKVRKIYERHKSVKSSI